MFPYVRALLFALTVTGLYFFWEWGGASLLEKSVHAPVTVSAEAIGKQAPEFRVSKDRIWAKQDFLLSSLRGTPIVLHFWATWCGPCLQELPELIERSKKLRLEGYSVVAVAVDESWSKLETFFARNPALRELTNQSILILDPRGEIADKFGSSRFPETFLINDQLVIDNKLVGAQPWTQAQMDPYLGRLRTRAATP